MRHPFRVLKTAGSAGFTLIELLIVMTILGILAVIAWAAINPLEQMNRGRDTSTRSDAEQLLAAIERYAALREDLPWWEDSDPSDPDVDFEDAIAVADGNGCLLTDKLSDGDGENCEGTDELKAAFVERMQNDNDLKVYYQDGSGNNPYVCFQPQSKAFLDEAKERCGSDSLPDDFPAADACPTESGNVTDDAYICLP